MAFDGCIAEGEGPAESSGVDRAASELASELAWRTRASLAAVRDDPEGRYQRRVAFYRRHGFGWAGAGYGTAELSFMRWEIRRGLLNPVDHPRRPGSPYWRAINEDLAFGSEIAGALHLAGHGAAQAGGAVTAAWLAYLRRPSARAWYHAHNVGLLHAMAERAEAAAAEPLEERRFINETLYRVIYVEAAVSGAVGPIGRVLVDPRLFAVHAVVRIPPLYPSRYPVPAPVLFPLRRRIARAIDAAGQGLVVEPRAFHALVVGRLRPLVGDRLDDAEIFRRFTAGEPLYPELVPRAAPAPAPAPAPRPAPPSRSVAPSAAPAALEDSP